MRNTAKRLRQASPPSPGLQRSTERFRLSPRPAWSRSRCPIGILRARDYIADHFIDPEYGGVFWSVDADGKPLDTKKQYYAIAFTIYGLSEHYRATGDTKSLEMATKLFHDIERHSRDNEKGGYLEASTRDWKEISDMQLSYKDDNACKTMNTHLHILEACTSLLRVWRDPGLLQATTALLEIFLDIIQDARTGHMGLFFDADWRRMDRNVSYGHDIEASWLLLECAEVIDEPALYERTLQATERMAVAALEGRRDDGSMVYELHGDGRLDDDRHWWVQAEDVIGLVYLWCFHGHKDALQKAEQSWSYIDSEIVDHEEGEWYWSRRGSDGSIDRDDDKAGFWKCPYHNGRMCMEVISRLNDDQ